jgi:protein-disulfide isomerase
MLEECQMKRFGGGRAAPYWPLAAAAGLALGASLGSHVTDRAGGAPYEVQEVDVSQLGYDFGEPHAPVRVVEFSDFGCGYCRLFHVETFPALNEEFIQQGKVSWKYIPFVTGMFANGNHAAVTGECAGEQGRFIEMSERLYRDQKEWMGSRATDPTFRRYAQEAGLDLTRFEQCVQQGWRSERVLTSSQAAFRLGVRGTPTFFVDDYPVSGAIPLDVFRDFLNAMLAAKDSAG